MPARGFAMLGCILALIAGCGGGSSVHRRSTSNAQARLVPDGVTLVYAIEPYGGPVTTPKVNRTVEVIDARLEGLGSGEAWKSSVGCFSSRSLHP